MLNFDKDFMDKIVLLYVEDDEDIAKSMVDILKNLFKHVYYAKNGKEGLEMFEKYQPQIVLTDIQMPLLDGFEMSREIKKLNPDTHIIISSAFSDASYLKEAIMIGVYNYITKPVDMKVMLKTLNRVLSNLHDKYELDKKNVELIVAKNKAESANRAKSQFLANMSHEIRTPLNAIMGFIDLLKEEKLNGKSLEFINIIDSSSKNLLQIIEDILDFSKIESGKLEIEKIDFDARSEFLDIINLFKARCSEKNIFLHVNIDKNLPDIINTDPFRVKQVISNLLSNAIKFTERGKNIFVDISCNKEKKHLMISVKDEGKGIAKDKLTTIFEAFSQEDGSTTRKYGGTGLGLTISSSLVKLLGGELKVKSELGKGSEFYFYVPIKKGKQISKNSISYDNISFGGKHILLAEDNEANQLFMKIVLKKLNLTTDIANDGLEAVELFEKNRYDAILMDENMPNMSGLDATKKILEIEKKKNLKHTPIIALTANALKGDRERFIKDGMDEYLSKPVDKNKLIEVLSRLTV